MRAKTKANLKSELKMKVFWKTLTKNLAVKKKSAYENYS